jgi:transcriptional regulator with XRE-family HTH domain
MSPEECWIRYNLNLKNIKLEAIAKKARRSVPLVSRVLSGSRRSEKVQAALAELLGYPSWQHLWADAFINSERKAI